MTKKEGSFKDKHDR